MKIFQSLINCPKIKFSDHKAAAGAVRRRRKRLVAAGCKPASAWSAFFSKGVQSRKKTSIIYTKNHHFYNTFNPIETAHKTPFQHTEKPSFTIKTSFNNLPNTPYTFLKIQTHNQQNQPKRPQQVLEALPLLTAPKTPGAPSFPALLEKTPSPSPSPESTCSSTDSRTMKPLPQLKAGLTLWRRLAELHKLRSKTLNFLCEPNVRNTLYWILCIILIIKEYLIKKLLKE